MLLPPAELEPEEGFSLGEWRRVNAIRLEKKDKKEKELRQQFIEEAEENKIEFYRKRGVTVEKLFLGSWEKFHAEADKHYWKEIGELIPQEVPTTEKRGK